MSLSIVVNGGGTFTASMEEGPVSFTASLAAVGPKGDTGPGVAVGGTTGQVLAKASATNYDTEWVARNPFNQDLNTTDTVNFGEVRIPSPDNHAKLSNLMWRPFSNAYGDNGIEYLGDKVVFADDTEQSTALPTGTADGNIVEWNADTSAYVSVPNDARTLFIRGTNKTGTTIAKGKAVYISGATGNHPEITLAQANSELSSARTIGITSESIANNATGRVIVAGLLENVNTSAFSASDTLYLSASTAGGFQTTLPTQPNHGVLLGYVTRSNANNGVIEVRVDDYQELGEQSDVLLTSKTNLDLLSYETSSGLWKNKSFSTLGLLTSATAASTYAPLASPTFTGTVTIPAGASISGYLTTATAASTYAAIASTNTFTASQVISVTDNSNAALRVTQLGTGNAFVVEDSANPDASPFVINADGNIGIGRQPTSRKLEMTGNLAVTGQTNLSTSTGNINVLLVESHASNTADCVLINNAGTGASFRVNDVASDTTPFIVDAGGNVGVKTSSPSTDFEVNGNAKFTTGNITTAPAAADSSSLIPTTAWVQAEVPAASTTAAGKVELATDAEAVAGTSATLAVTPSGNLESKMWQGLFMFPSVWTAATSGAGTLTSTGDPRFAAAPTSVAGYGLVRIFANSSSRGATYNRGIDFDKRITTSFRMALRDAGTDANSVLRITMGKVVGDNAGDLARKGFGVKCIGGGLLVLTVHNGTSLTDTNSTHTMADGNAIDVRIVSEGGTVTLFVNSSQVASTTSGPAGLGSTAGYAQIEAENTTTLSGTRIACDVVSFRTNFAL